MDLLKRLRGGGKGGDDRAKWLAANPGKGALSNPDIVSADDARLMRERMEREMIQDGARGRSEGTATAAAKTDA